ncbi:hypothetical protein [Nitrosospira sp. Is2]|uniref:hypothetical protein n=1 Tax=Nitrosospira sp. Is2 TaxID=3080532 RepID=UPI00295310F6|nr:hypothetical protein [Nitrosospira sp. Is2]WON74167.1 hypothetical protein R5L00_01365 [Nitrosospira sp. Is2]
MKAELSLVLFYITVMLTSLPQAHTIRHLLENLEFKIVLESPDNDYRIEYFTTSLKDRVTRESKFTRTYHLIDQVRGGVTPEHWDTFDLEKQVDLVVNLLTHCDYRVVKVVNGWEASCPSCKKVMQGKTWQPFPKKCSVKRPRKCKMLIERSSIIETLFPAAAIEAIQVLGA